MAKTRRSPAGKQRIDAAAPSPAQEGSKVAPRVRRILGNKWSRGLLLFGATVSATFFLEPFWPLGNWKWLFLSLFFLVLYFFEWWYPKLVRFSLLGKALTLLIAAVAVGCLAWFSARWFPGVAEEPEAPAEIALRMSHAYEPALWMVNTSDGVARQPSYQVLLYLFSRDSEPHNLLIPVKSDEGNFVLPRRALGPWTIARLSRDWKEPSRGDLFLGIGKSWCLNCSKTNVYLIEIRAGQEPLLIPIDPASEGSIERTIGTVVNASDPFIAWNLYRDDVIRELSVKRGGND